MAWSGAENAGGRENDGPSIAMHEIAGNEIVTYFSSIVIL